MADKSPYTWKPNEILEVTNISDQNMIFELDSGPLRLDKGRTYRFTASVMQNHEIVALAYAGKLKVEPYRKRNLWARLNL